MTESKRVVAEFRNVLNHGFFRVATIVPLSNLGDPKLNAQEHFRKLENVYQQGANYALGPELGISGYSLGDLHQADLIISESKEALRWLLKQTADWEMMFTVGIALLVDSNLFNCAVTCHKGKVLTVTPKLYPPNYREFYEGRHFAAADETDTDVCRLFGYDVKFGSDVLVRSLAHENFVLHVEICEDGWVPIPPSSFAALHGATVLANLSASNATIGKASYCEALFTISSARNAAVQIYTSAGPGESTTDVVWDGRSFVCERGQLISSGELFTLEGTTNVVDVDLGMIVQERLRQTSFRKCSTNNPKKFRIVEVESNLAYENEEVYWQFKRTIDPTPFVPSDPSVREIRCEEVMNMLVAGLVQRLRSLPENMQKVVIGISGGVDSTLAGLVAARAMDKLALPRTNIIALTLPGFGTTGRTYRNACAFSKAIGADFREKSIQDLANQVFQDSGYNSETSNDTLPRENIQAWSRTHILLAVACRQKAIMLGTGDLSELSKGWCTYLGDHASHYGINSSVAKSLIPHLIWWSADNTFADDKAMQEVLRDIVDTPYSPELLQDQDTEAKAGPYRLTDFFLYWMVRFGYRPSKIARMAEFAFQGEYELEFIRHWLIDYLNRFFSNQFKRDCLPGGVKVGLVSLSPRGDWRMAADTKKRPWIKDAEAVPTKLSD